MASNGKLGKPGNVVVFLGTHCLPHLMSSEDTRNATEMGFSFPGGGQGIMEELNVPEKDVEELLVSLILDNRISGHIDQMNRLLERSDRSKGMKKYTAVDKWNTQLKSNCWQPGLLRLSSAQFVLRRVRYIVVFFNIRMSNQTLRVYAISTLSMKPFEYRVLVNID